MPLRIITAALVGCLLFSGCGPDLREGVAEAYATLPDQVDFNFHVKPILSDRCYACHGPDAQNQQADLRLDNADGAYAALASGHGYAIVPGKPGRSEMIARINSDDPELVMPTPESNLTLSDREIAILTKWVEQGAEYKDHWAFVKPAPQSVPTAGADWAHNDIDRFVAAKLEQEGVAPSPEAERPYLIRRAYFDLTGLPPALNEIDRWETAAGDDWYERMVDELMARPAYGERMATYWMDVARFADSEGYLDDFHHELWPYRDWVINAYNKNLPYDKFIEWQIGGDQLEAPTTEQVLATTFNRTHKQNSEGGIIPEEFRVEYVADRANTVGTAFMGLTMGCARCHDHKYDPISQKDYFELFAFFNQTIERGDAIFAINGVRNDRSEYNRRSMNAGPTLLLPDSTTRSIHAHLRELIARQEADLSEATLSSPAPASAPKAGQNLNPTLEQRILATRLHDLDFEDPKLRDRVTNHDVYNQLSAVPAKFGRSLKVSDGQYVTKGDHSLFEHSDPFTVSFWIKAPELYEEAHFFYNGSWRIQGYRGWDVKLDSNRVHFRLNHAHPFQSIDVRLDQPLGIGEWTHFTWTYDGSGRAAGVRLYRNGRPAEPTVMRDHLTRSTVPYHGADYGTNVYAHYNGLTIGSLQYDPDFSGGELDNIVVLDHEAGDLLARYLYHRATGAATTATPAELAEYRQLHEDPELQRRRAALRELRRRAIVTLDTVREIMVMGDLQDHRRQTYVLDRGMYDAHGEPVDMDIPEALMDWPEDLPRNRLGLARWLTHPDNPLTARVAVNQMWYLMFGRGIVESVEDFGNQGALPSHPALLDWLALDFRENGWDVKRLVRQMVTSATYRQSSKIRPELADVDPDNYWLARAPRYRRSAEMVRDNALASAGLLDDELGGASTFPYQPAGLWKEVNNHGFSPYYVVDTTTLYRRSLYTFWKRNAPAPMMLTFDAALRGECQVRRQRSNTPLQALVLLNDPTTLEACRVLASNSLRETDDPRRARSVIFRTLTGRAPTVAEADILDQYYEDELSYFHANPVAAQEFLATGYHQTDLSGGNSRVAALARVANSVMNSTEGYYKN